MTSRILIKLGEYKSKRQASGAPSPSDLRLAEQLAGRDLEPRIIVRWLSTGEIDIVATSWVGVVRFSNVEIHIVPKLVGGPLRVLRMLEYASGVSLLKRLPIDRPLPSDGDDLFDLICMLLAEETKSILGAGLMRDYRPVDEPLEVLRGRLRHRDQFLRRFGQLRPLECTFDEHDGDIPENQLIAAALSIARGHVHDPAIKVSINRLVALFADACEPASSDSDWYKRTIQYGRRNDRYRAAHELAHLVLRHAALDDIYGTARGQASAFMLDMNVVFERFITRLVQDALATTELTVDRQSSVRTVIHDDERGRPYGAIRPDLVVSQPSTGRSAPIDIKYKLYDEKKISPGDIYQLFLYAYAFGVGEAPHHAGLLYPAERPTSGPLLSIKPLAAPTAAKIVGAGLDVPAALDSIAADDITELHVAILERVRLMTGF